MRKRAAENLADGHIRQLEIHGIRRLARRLVLAVDPLRTFPDNFEAIRRHISVVPCMPFLSSRAPLAGRGARPRAAPLSRGLKSRETTVPARSPARSDPCRSRAATDGY